VAQPHVRHLAEKGRYDYSVMYANAPSRPAVKEHEMLQLCAQAFYISIEGGLHTTNLRLFIHASNVGIQ